MKNKILLLVLLNFFLVSCSSQLYRQAGSDIFSLPIPDGKAIVIFDAVAELYGNRGKMLVAFSQFEPNKSRYELYQSPEWDFATYPGAIIPGYAGEEPHGLHAYILEPGLYVAVRCVYAAPEADYCPEGVWTNINDQPVGMAFFELKSGDVLNIGQLQVLRTARHTYTVSINNNQRKAEKYIEQNWPKLTSKLQYKPLQFTY